RSDHGTAYAARTARGMVCKPPREGIEGGTAGMAELTIGHRDEPRSIAAVAAAFAALHPGYSLGYAVVEGGEQDLTTDGRARLAWVDRGAGEVWLEEGYRTNEGDGVPLPPAYACDPLGATDRDALQTLARALPTAHPGVAAPLRAIVERYDG